MVCDICGTAFEVVKSWQKRCSAKCNTIASNTRRRIDPSVKTCRTCRERLPVDSFLPAHRSCVNCEELKEAGRKRCSRCGQVKLREDFPYRSSRPDDRDSRCKACRSAESKERNAKPEKKLSKRDRDYRAKYGIGLAEVEDMLRRQGGRCAICRVQQGESPFHVDHNHATGAVRSLLCLKCNALLGQCSEDPDILMAAIEYLRRHSDVSCMGS